MDPLEIGYGRGLHVIEEIAGRNTDFLIHENGSIIHALAAIYILRETGGVGQFKITQQAINEFEVLIVTNPFWNPESSKTIEQKFKSRFGGKCKTHIQSVNKIPSEASGK